MCTLSYLLTSNGYELFFNRDEQHQRPIAIAPQYYSEYHAIFPVDPQGQGTWLAVHQSGLSLALLNFYQACQTDIAQDFVSRGQLIPALMKTLKQVVLSQQKYSVEQQLQNMDLSVYQPFQLGIFPDNLSKKTGKFKLYQWDGVNLSLTDKQQPFTSSGVDFEYVEKKRQDRFKQLICPLNATSEQFKAFHLSQETEGKYSVNMLRFDAKTVSMSHICVGNNIQFNYYDNVENKHYSTTIGSNIT